MLYAHIQAQRGAERDAFAARLGVPVIVYKQARVAASEVAPLRTRVLDMAELGNPTLLLSLPKDIHSYRLFRFTPEGPKRRIKAGRGRECDIVLNDKSVSGLHAFFDVAGGIIELIDNTSRNGTRVNERLVTPGKPVILQNADTLMLGSTHLQFFTPGGLYDFLKSLAPAAS